MVLLYVVFVTLVGLYLSDGFRITFSATNSFSGTDSLIVIGIVAGEGR